MKFLLIIFTMANCKCLKLLWYEICSVKWVEKRTKN